MTAPAEAIAARDLTKTFMVRRPLAGRFATVRSLFDRAREERTVVSDLSFSVGRGELVGLLGPNGAGKSTTIKMLTGVVTPTSGEVHVDGRVPHRHRVANARSVGAVFGQKTQLWWDLPARQSFELLRDMFDIPNVDYDLRIRELDDTLGIFEFWETPTRLLSLGERVRCDLAAAVLHDPRVVFLDEPTIGMDVLAKERTRAFLLHQVRHRGRAVLLTTHDMGDVARLCERVMLINHGRLMFDGTLDEIGRAYGRRRIVRVTFDEQVAEPTVPGARLDSLDGSVAVFTPNGDNTPEDVVRALISRFAVASLSVEEANLEDLMREAYLGKFGTVDNAAASVPT